MPEKKFHNPETLVSKSQLELILDASPIGVSISRYYDGELLYVNASLAHMYRGSRQDMLGKNSLIFYADRDDIAWVLDQLKQGRTLTDYEMKMNQKGGRTIWCQVHMVATRVKEEKVILSWFMDITEKRRFQARLEHMASHDTLTGLANRARFNEFLTRAIARARRLDGVGSLIYLDLDGFKQVNDTLGHGFGDFLLEQSAKRLNSVLRETDFIARLGGDEFAVVIEAFTDQKRPQQVAEKILSCLSAPFEEGGQAATVGASIGIANFGKEPMEIEVLQKRADTAMYQAKHAGKGRICLYDADHDRYDLIYEPDELSADAG